MQVTNAWLLAATVALFAGCSTRSPISESPREDSGPPLPDRGPPLSDSRSGHCADPEGDFDSDGISNRLEGCGTGRDSDGDGVPDWQDSDSDGDKVLDRVERGGKDASGRCKDPIKAGADGWPCDSDGDKLPDYLDRDSDDDGLSDGFEDENGDGLLGCCLSECFKAGSTAQKRCKLVLSDPGKPTDGCGAGQTCTSGKCVPPVHFLCSEGETYRRRKDTFGDTRSDKERGTFICRDATEAWPQGRKPVLYKKSDAARGDWILALEKHAKYGPLTISNPGKKMFAAAIDHDRQTDEVAGFVISRDATREVQSELAALITGLRSSFPPGSTTAVTLRTSGVQAYTHDLYDSVQGTILDLTLASTADISSVRNAVVASLLGKKLSDLTNLPQSYGGSYSPMILKFSTVKRVDLKRDTSGRVLLDASGKPLTTGDKSKWRLMVIGAVAAHYNYQDRHRPTRTIIGDLSNTTALAEARYAALNECDVGIITKLPVADIIWVVDESLSMNDNRQNIVNNATDFFSRAVSSGLDFRIGVTNVCSPTGSYKEAVGKFCSRISSATNDLGGSDRFLLSSEQTLFSSCVYNPPGYPGNDQYSLVNAREAVKRHLPRAANDPSRIRPDAKLVIIVATDEIADSLSGTLFGLHSTCTLSAASQASLSSAMSPYLNFFSGAADPGAAAIYTLIGGVCNNTCSANINHGHALLAKNLQGQIADICQKDLSSTLQEVIDGVINAAAPVVLDYHPISASLAVALDAVAIPRSTVGGFVYNASSNSLAFINVKHNKGSEVLASYKRWVRQTF
jgi:hypothetical protein